MFKRFLPFCGSGDNDDDWGGEISPEQAARREADRIQLAREDAIYAGGAKIYKPSNLWRVTNETVKFNAGLYAALVEFNEQGGKHTLGYFGLDVIPRPLDGKSTFIDLHISINKMISANLQYDNKPEMFNYNGLYEELVREYKIRTKRYFGTPDDEIAAQERLAGVIGADPKSRRVADGTEPYARSKIFGDGTADDKDLFDLGQSALRARAGLASEAAAARGGAAAAAASRLEPYAGEVGGVSLFGVSNYGTPEAKAEQDALVLLRELPGV